MILPFVFNDRDQWLKKLRPPKHLDIRLWVPPPGKKKFETSREVENRQADWAAILDDGDILSQQLGALYRNCYDEEPCSLSFEPECIRQFRINYVWRVAEAIKEHFPDEPLFAVTTVSEPGQFAVGDLGSASFSDWKQETRQNLVRAGLGDFSVIGGGCISYNEYSGNLLPSYWQVHGHYIFIGGTKNGIHRRLRKVYRPTDNTPQAVSVVAVTDLLGAISYTYKSVFPRRVSYVDDHGHRNTRGGLPIDKPHLQELALFMATQKFSDRLFLRGFRRRGHILVPE
jgi:hypothetical protein